LQIQGNTTKTKVFPKTLAREELRLDASEKFTLLQHSLRKKKKIEKLSTRIGFASSKI